MKKITVTFLMFFFSFSVAFAGPFGLSKGMSVEQISKLSEKGFEPERVSKFLLIIKHLPTAVYINESGASGT